MCGTCTLTFIGQAKKWCQSLSDASIRRWDEFITNFLHAFQDYDYGKVCIELENLKIFEGESIMDFIIRFKLICLKYQPQNTHFDI